MAQLEETIRAIPPDQALDSQAGAMLLAAWSMVHGFAHLMLDGKLAHMHAGGTPKASPRVAILRSFAANVSHQRKSPD